MSELTPEERALRYAWEEARHPDDDAIRRQRIIRYWMTGYRAAEADCERRIAEAVAQYKADAERLRSALVFVTQAYRNKHSPQHRAFALAEAEGAIRAEPKGEQK